MTRDLTKSRKSLAVALSDVGKAQAAVQALSANFDVSIQEEVARLDAARVALSRDGFDIAAVSALYMRAHDLKGLAPTFGYPLVHQVAATLCELIDNDSLPFEERLPIIDDHIDAIRAFAFSGIRTAADPRGRRLLDQIASDLEGLAELR